MVFVKLIQPNVFELVFFEATEDYLAFGTRRTLSKLHIVINVRIYTQTLKIKTFVKNLHKLRVSKTSKKMFNLLIIVIGI